MQRKPAVILRAAEIAASARAFTQRLNPSSLYHGAELSRPGGIRSHGVSWARLPPGKESFAYHAHDVQEEWMFALSGQAIALIDGVEHAIGPGDFIAFPAPQVAHLVKNPGPDDFIYLMGGDRPPMDLLTYPALGERYMLRGEEGRAAFYKLGDPAFPFGLADKEK